MAEKKLVFPQGFLWGAATASHQVEGDNKNNDWWEWEKAGKTKDVSGKACDHYNRYKEDFALARSLHHNAHRLSLEWSRLEPEAGTWNQKEFDHYRDVLRELRAQGLEPFLTLQHFSLPLWLDKKGGWISDELPDHFERFTHKVVRELGENVRFWITINEPLVFNYFGFVEGKWPPGIKDFRAFSKGLRNFFVAHQKAYRVIHTVYEEKKWPKPQVGFSANVTYHAPCRSWNPLDRLSAYLRNQFLNHYFFDTLLKGHIHMPGLLSEKLPEKGTLDFLGLNYYMREFVRYTGGTGAALFGTLSSNTHHKDIAKRNDMGWESYPRGLYLILQGLRKYHLPIYITENGTCVQDDADRWDYLKKHLAVVHQAASEGVPLKGYLCWSMLDNFEWDSGFSRRFGIVEVNYQTFERKIRDSGYRYGEVCKNNTLVLD